MQSILALLSILATLYLALLVVYRLCFAPAARFPGPNLAALTYFYEFFYDVWNEGQYTWKLRDLHDKYGPFVRINPHEVHCNDPAFFDVLYVGSAKRRTDKPMWLARQSWTRNSTFKTIEHDLHKLRRNQLSSFFSKASIRTLEPLITGKIDRLCSRLEEASGTKKVLSLTHAFVALTLDIISRVCFGSSYGCLELEDFAQDWYRQMVSESRTGNLVRHFPWIFQVTALVPRMTSRATADGLQAANRRKADLARGVSGVVERYARGYKKPKDAFTIFDAILEADVPPHEKSVARLTEEAQALTGAGTMTTATALDATIFYLLKSPTCLKNLRQELNAAVPNLAAMPTFAELEKLPYLTAVLHEALRLSKSVPHRLARVSPDVSYHYGDVIIPKDVPVGMTMMDTLENPDIFPEPHHFLPERWLPFDSPEVRQRRKHLVVFGGGTRMCLGLNLAWAELYLTIAAVVRRFGHRLSLHDVVFDRDLKITVDGFNALPSRESKGLRVLVSADVE